MRKYFYYSSRYPRLDHETLLPVATNIENSQNECWYPPGHGDVYQAFHQSGLLYQFIEQGKEYMFLSNIDNLGATVDLCKIVYYYHHYFFNLFFN
jgi:UTP--glucose-1-phosphate uridylyltransferase